MGDLVNSFNYLRHFIKYSLIKIGFSISIVTGLISILSMIYIVGEQEAKPEIYYSFLLILFLVTTATVLWLVIRIGKSIPGLNIDLPTLFYELKLDNLQSHLKEKAGTSDREGSEAFSKFIITIEEDVQDLRTALEALEKKLPNSTKNSELREKISFVKSLIMEDL